MVTESELTQFLRENPPAKKFVPYCYLSKEADTLTVYFEGDADYSKRLCDHVTVYISLETGEVVGCRIKGISGLLEDLPNYIQVKHGKVALSVIFLAFWGGARDDEASKAMNQLARVASEHEMVLEPSM
ncbi:MAG: hypothetical protein ACYTG0_01775 [Planctomycetota bacterium]|jgi:hypothetical protein